jgi:hypothetical protein
MEAKQGPPRVLVVEDDFLIAMQTEIALTAAGFEVIGPATTAEEAVAMAGEAQPTLAVMDIRLASTRDGIDAAGNCTRTSPFAASLRPHMTMRIRAGAPSPMPRSDGCRSRTPWLRWLRWLPKPSRGCAGRSAPASETCWFRATQGSASRFNYLNRAFQERKPARPIGSIAFNELRKRSRRPQPRLAAGPHEAAASGQGAVRGRVVRARIA